MATIKEVAHRAGVGIGTVSRVLNEAEAVSPATRARVQQAIAELNYHPSHAARQLVTARTQTIGVILPFLTRPFYINVLQGIESKVAATPYHLNIFSVENGPRRSYYFDEMPYRGRVDGLIVVSLPLTDTEVARLHAIKLPTVLVDGFHPALPTITMQNVAGARTAVEYLLSRGHSRIAFISGPVEADLGFTVNRDRLQGYLAALRAYNVTPQSAYQLAGEDTHADGGRMTNILLDLPTPPTAIFACSDVHALGVLQAVQARGLRVPDDVAVVGYDDIELAAYFGLTTVRQPMAEMGRRGLELLLQAVEEPGGEPVHHCFTASLIIRHTA